MRNFKLALLGLMMGLGAISGAFAAPAFMVDAEGLEEMMEDKKLVILEVRYYPHRYYTIGHIPGAVQVQRFKDLGDNNSDSLMKFPSKQAFQNTLRNWSINNDSKIVIYDDSSTALASRLYFLLEFYGFDMKNVKILDGGTVGWTGFNDLTKEATPVKKGTVELKEANKAMSVEWTTVYDRIVSRRDKNMVLLDARPHKHYTGEVKAHAVRAGHIPGAVNIVSLDGVVGESMTWKSKEELAAMYKSLPKDKTIIAYCHDGFRMSLAWLQLKGLGYKNVRLYNGGWGHWGNKFSLPIVKGSEVFDANFKL